MGERILKGFDGYLVLNETQNSDDISIGHASKIAVHVVVDNTNAAGELLIQGSNNRDNWVTINWEDADGTLQDGYDITSGNNVNHIFDMDTACGWLRVRYIRTSGTGGLDFYLNTKRG